MTPVDEFRKYIEGKSVAIVGNAPFRESLKLKPIIDSSDVVVRINKVPENGPGAPGSGYHSENVGSRTDVMYLYPPIEYLGDPNSAPGAIVCQCAKFVCALPDVSWHDLDDIRKVVKTRHVDFSLMVDWYNKHYSKPMTGTMAVLDIMNQNPSKVLLVGLHCHINADSGMILDQDVVCRNRPWTDFNYLKWLVGWHHNVFAAPDMEEMFEKYGVWIDNSKAEGDLFSGLPHSKEV